MVREGGEEGEILELRKPKSTEHSSKRSGEEKGVKGVVGARGFYF